MEVSALMLAMLNPETLRTLGSPSQRNHVSPPVRRLSPEASLLHLRQNLKTLQVCACIVLACQQFGSSQPASNSKDKAQFRIEIESERGAQIAGTTENAPPSKSSTASVVFHHEYQPGDRIIFSGPRRMALRVDEMMPECMIYAPESPSGGLVYQIPYGRAEAQTGSAYAPESFTGPSHRVTIRSLKKKEVSAYRNLALNPCDVPLPEQAAPRFFPHASSNSVSRSLFDFEARNAIDGQALNGHHGVWPYQSWGPQLRTDIWWKVDFGRPVELDKIRLMVRADFPHNSYWKSAEVEFSDGSRLPLQISSSAEFQDFPFSKRRVSWLRITNVVPEDPSKWCSFIEAEAWGKELH